jgi:hypothetical protein|tara:strand:+ start:59 stop:337 length:279 start_codon:yes stop_codon:yes gene_type:complete
MIKLITDIIGKNTNGQICHPYEHQRGPRFGKYVYTLTGIESFEEADEAALRILISSGAFNSVGRIRMVPKDAKSTTAGSALRVISYMGKSLS